MTDPTVLHTLTHQERQALKEAVTDFNDDLVTRNINIAGQAFANALTLGCGGFGLLSAIVILIAYLISRLSWISVFIYIGTGVLLALLFAAVVANRAKQIYLHEADTSQLTEKITSYLNRTGFTLAQVHALAEELYPEDAPIRVYLAQHPLPAAPQAAPPEIKSHD